MRAVSERRPHSTGEHLTNAAKVGQASRLPGRAKRGLGTNSATFGAAGQAGRLPYVFGTTSAVVARPILTCATLISAAALCALLCATGCETAKPALKESSTPSMAVMQSEFIYETAPFPSCHASTLAETADGLVAAWFGGKDEGKADVGIWFARRDTNGWTAPVEVANGVQKDQKRFPCWNPVLFQSREGPLLLFYKVGPRPPRWWGMLITSADGGKTWGAPRRLPDGILGPIKNKPVLLPDGTLLCPSSTEHDGWRVHLERTSDLGLNWTKTGSLNSPQEFGAIQPTVLFHPNNRLQILCRSRQNVITECWSDDGGKTWGPMKATSLLNPSSGIDAVTLRDGRHLLVYNPNRRGRDDRTPLVLAVSADGKSWKQVATLEDQPGEYSYPAIIQTRDGLVHITYTWKRQRVRHVVVDPAKLAG